MCASLTVAAYRKCSSICGRRSSRMCAAMAVASQRNGARSAFKVGAKAVALSAAYCCWGNQFIVSSSQSHRNGPHVGLPRHGHPVADPAQLLCGQVSRRGPAVRPPLMLSAAIAVLNCELPCVSGPSPSRTTPFAGTRSPSRASTSPGARRHDRLLSKKS